MPGEYPLQDIVAASKPHLALRADPVILYISAAAPVLNPEYVDITRTAFENLAEVEILDLTQPIPFVDVEHAIQETAVLYIPGGNTYLLLERLYRSKAFHLIQTRIQAGMPLLGFSAGMRVCGENILTSNDINDCGCTKYTGFGFTEYNFVAHYPAGDGEESVQRDHRIREYHHDYANPVLALEDDGCVEIGHEGTKIVRGHCWLFEPGREKVLLEHGYIR